ncbi:phosphate signaling complex protein PhoU [Hyphococcus luteus]|jgi:phosphate transport system protein|uniref:Phosphate-specific transport system accessory protein PhoU n=1 Tax=Hyphococcus luteus TaxID=2058213 RepID=A0A2S7K7G4_9PROT|nr:phosphate signaling complex protein PhoU [Marinicaulis flavus]PQA88440.1 phosphate transport system regulatory protein PhoU [Marinicaulis flavus]
MATLSPQSSHQERLDLETSLSRMAAQVENQLANAVTAFERRDLAAAEKVIEGDERIDALDHAIEAKVMELLQKGPLPEDALREVMTVSKLAGELERVGDLAKNVSKRTLVVSREAPARPTSGVARMGRASLRQFSDILNAYAARNLSAAIAVWSGDDDLDQLYNSVFEEILVAMMHDSSNINACTHLVFTAKNFERVGDHATNIAEALHFLLTGSRIIENRPKGDKTSTTVVSPPKQSGSAAG